MLFDLSRDFAKHFFVFFTFLFCFTFLFEKRHWDAAL